MTAIVLSLLGDRAPESLDNHARYARRHGYRHEVVETSGMPQDRQLRMLYKYEVLLNTLRRAEAGQLVLLLTENAAIVDPVPLAALMDGRAHLIAKAWSHPLPQGDIQIWRNTAEMRCRVLEIANRFRLGEGASAVEAELLGEFDPVEASDTIAEVCPVKQAGYSVGLDWVHTPTFAISIDGEPNRPGRRGICARFRNALVGHLNERKTRGLPLFSFPEYDGTETEERSTYYPGNRVALTTLYTPNVGMFGRIAERNMRRYCERHGYTLYVHRDIPAEIGLRASGNWVKPWLLYAYLQHHEWAVWMDADVLIADQDRALEPDMADVDQLVAHDVGQWPLNAGVIGLRKTPTNEAALTEWMKIIVNLADRSTVYAENGDQFHFIQALRNGGQLDDGKISDFVRVNTPWMFRRPDSFMLHYFGMWPEMRALMMAHDDARSART